MNNIKSTDIIQRVFTKMRGTYAQEQKFTTCAGIFTYDGEDNHSNDDLLRRLVDYMVQTFLGGTFQKELGCSNTEPLDNFEVIEIEDESITKLAFMSSYAGNGNKQHTICQEYFLKHDKYTLAYELPVYNHERSGFIDIIRYVDGKIQILDLKPLASKENKIKVGSQLKRYQELLSHQLNCDPDLIELFYFDEEAIYQVINKV